MTIYVVIGNYADSDTNIEWLVAAYYRKDDADEHARLANAAAICLQEQSLDEGQNPYDAKPQCYANQARYFVTETKLFDDLTAYKIHH